MTKTAEQLRVRVMSPKAVLSYPHLFEATTPPGSDTAKFSCVLVFPEGTDLTAMEKAAFSVAKTSFGANVKDLIKRGKVRWPFRADEDDVKDKGYPSGSVFMNVNSRKKPGVVDASVSYVDDPDEAYAGRFVRASLTCYAYDVSGNKGVTFGLNNVQLLEHGERLDGRVAAADEFEAVEEAIEDPTSGLDEADENDLSDLMS